MERFFGGNMLVLLEGARCKPDKNGLWWDFDAIDAFIRKAKTLWQVKELMCLPQWWIPGWVSMFRCIRIGPKWRSSMYRWTIRTG